MLRPRARTRTYALQFVRARAHTCALQIVPVGFDLRAMDENTRKASAIRQQRTALTLALTTPLFRSGDVGVAIGEGDERTVRVRR